MCVGSHLAVYRKSSSACFSASVLSTTSHILTPILAMPLFAVVDRDLEILCTLHLLNRFWKEDH